MVVRVWLLIETSFLSLVPGRPRVTQIYIRVGIFNRVPIFISIFQTQLKEKSILGINLLFAVLIAESPTPHDYDSVSVLFTSSTCLINNS